MQQHNHAPAFGTNFVATSTTSLVGITAGSSLYQAQSNPGTTSNTGGGDSQNLQPYRGANYIVKT